MRKINRVPPSSTNKIEAFFGQYCCKSASKRVFWFSARLGAWFAKRCKICLFFGNFCVSGTGGLRPTSTLDVRSIILQRSWCICHWTRGRSLKPPPPRKLRWELSFEWSYNLYNSSIELYSRAFNQALWCPEKGRFRSCFFVVEVEATSAAALKLM